MRGAIHGTHGSTPAPAAKTCDIFPGMHRRPSLLLRTSRALIGLVTLWCLGCSSYEPLLGSLFGAGPNAMMICDSDMAAASTTPAASAVADQGHANRVTAAPTDNRSFDCGCGGSCHAPSPNLATIVAAAAPVPAIEQLQPSEPASISRAPLLPPPQLTA